MLGGNVIVQGIERLPSEKEGKKGKIINLTRDENFGAATFSQRAALNTNTIRSEQCKAASYLNGKKVTSNVYGCSFKDEKPLVESFRVERRKSRQTLR